MLKVILRQFVVLSLCLFSFSLHATFPVDEIHQKGHHFNTAQHYGDIQVRVQELLVSGVSARDILVITDWDDVINGEGAWHQKKYDGSYVCEQTKRMLLEHEVDHKARDEHVHPTYAFLRRHSVPTFVNTARPPIIDDRIDSIIGSNSLMDLRCPDNNDIIHYEGIADIIRSSLLQVPDDHVLRHAKDKVDLMQQRSGLCLAGQEKLSQSFVLRLQDRKITFHDGFAFTAHDKGPCLVSLLHYLQLGVKHILIIDDSARAMTSYISMLEYIEAKVHLFHYPIPKV